MTTNVPSAVFGPNGFSAPAESEILAGVQADQNTAFGGNLNPSLSTPQGQLAQSLAAIVGDCNNLFLALANGVDPAYSSGRLQDGIGRIYFMERISAAPTIVTATCTGLVGTPIPIGAQARDGAGNVYICVDGGEIPSAGHIDLQFACLKTGPIDCPPGYLSTIYQTIPGWDRVLNAAGGTPGWDVESRSDFEWRRSQSVANNAVGTLPAIRGAVLTVGQATSNPVTDCYAAENPEGTPSGAVFTASISGTTMTVYDIARGTLEVGQMVVDSGGPIAPGTLITSVGSTGGGPGAYQINYGQTVALETMVSAVGGVSLIAHSIYLAIQGGADYDVAQAIWLKKMPGCNYNGSTAVTILDNTSGYGAPAPSYAVQFQRPSAVAVAVLISMQANPMVPANAVALVRAAVIAAFNGADGGPRARIGGVLFASRFYAGIASVGNWAMIYSIKIGTAAYGAVMDSFAVRVDQIPTISASNILVTFT